MRLQWLVMVRHGESTGNVAWQEAAGAGRTEVAIAERDADIPLSPTGRRQAAAVGRWLAALPAGDRPTAVLSSPYIRATETARIALEQITAPPVWTDERLRDREQGALQFLTRRGIEERYPEEAAHRRRLGKFYYRPPGGESWADVALRLRSALGDIQREHDGGRVLVVAHDAVIVLTRYILERLSEGEILDIEKTPVANGSITKWSADGLVTFNDTAHL